MDHSHKLLIPTEANPLVRRSPRISLNYRVLEAQVVLECALQVDSKVIILINVLANALRKKDALCYRRLL